MDADLPWSDEGESEGEGVVRGLVRRGSEGLEVGNRDWGWEVEREELVKRYERLRRN